MTEVRLEAREQMDTNPPPGRNGVPFHRRFRASYLLRIAIAAALLLPLLTASRPPTNSVAPAGLAGLFQPPAVSRTSAMPRTVALVTGDKLRLTTDAGGRSLLTPMPAKPSAGSPRSSFVGTFRIGGDLYAVPSEALPYLGSRLDPRLFDISYLQRAGYADLPSLPLSIDWRSATHRGVAGVTAPANGSHTAGSISPVKADDFGRSLAQGNSGALSQVKRISLGAPPASGPNTPGAGQVAAAPAAPFSARSAPAGSKLYTLTVNALDRAGQPGYAVVAIQNLDSFQRFYTLTAVVPGQSVSVSVPAGPYGVEAISYGLNQSVGLPTDISFVPAPQVTVANDTSITLDAREAQPITVTVPKSADTELADLDFARRSADGNGLEGLLYTFGPGLSSDLVPPVHLFAKPTPPAAKGSLGFADSWELVPPGTGFGGVDAPYTYNLDFPSANGVPADLSHDLTDKDLAAEHNRFAAMMPGDEGASTAIAFHSWSTSAVGFSPTLAGPYPLPTERTDYFSGAPTTIWGQAAVSAPPSPTFNAPTIFGPYRTFRPGDDTTVTWGNGPSVPAPEWQSVGLPADSAGELGLGRITSSYGCPVCRQGDVMAFQVVGSGDSDPTHNVGVFSYFAGQLVDSAGGPTTSLKFYRNGALTQLSASPGQMYPMLPGTASYRIDWTQDIPQVWTRLGTHVQSTWDFTASAPKKADSLPSYELCAPDPGQSCSYVPLIFAAYDFGADLHGQVPASGTETFTLTGYHEKGVTGRQVTKASVEVSFDDGASWAPATKVTDVGDGRFRVAVTQPDPSATSGFASLRVSLSDDAGDSLRQTVLHAYALTGSAPAAPGNSR